MRSLLKPIFLILAFAFLIRIIGVAYGLPLWLIDDEPPFILAALKMLDLKTLVPALHLDDFKTVLYYPPYLSYLYLPFFVIFLAGEFFVIFNGPASLFSSYLLSDLSEIFIMGRTVSAVLGVASIFLIYKAAQNIFRERSPALFAAFFVSTSLIHISLSMVSRHWLSVFFFTALVLFLLSNKNMPGEKRYFLAALSAGAGVGFAIINVLLMMLIVFWYLIYDKKTALAALKDKFIYGAGAVFAALAALPYALYPGSLGFSADTTEEAAKTIFGAITSPILFAKTIAVSEPILIFFAVFGLGFALWRARKVFWAFFAFIYAYSIIFYLIFRFEPRFFMGLLPFFALLAGYGFYETQKRIPQNFLSKSFLILLLIPLVFALRLGWLTIKNDSRALARDWIEANLPAGTKIITLARLTRFSTTASAVEEQTKIDPSSVRKIDLADAKLEKPNFHALNLFDANNPSFYENVERYIKENGYQYIVIQPSYRNSQYFKDVAKNGELIKTFGSGETAMSVAESQFLKNPLALFKIRELGPKVEIYKLK